MMSIMSKLLPTFLCNLIDELPVIGPPADELFYIISLYFLNYQQFIDDTLFMHRKDGFVYQDEA